MARKERERERDSGEGKRLERVVVEIPGILSAPSSCEEGGETFPLNLTRLETNASILRQTGRQLSGGQVFSG